MSYYYLHTNGDLIWKKFRPEDDSPFVKRIWPCDTSNRGDAWTIILESLALEADIARVTELSKKWNCDLKDFKIMLVHMEPTELMKKGATVFLEKILGINVEEFWTNFREEISNGTQATIQ